MNESTRKRVRDQLDQLRLLINDEHPTKKLDTKDDTEISIILGNLVYHQTGAGFNALGEDVITEIIKRALKDQKYGKSCAIPQVCKKWKKIYDGLENERLELYVSVVTTKWIWWIFIMHALEIDLFKSITKVGKKMCRVLESFIGKGRQLFLQESMSLMNEDGTLQKEVSFLRTFWIDYKIMQDIMQSFTGILSFSTGNGIGDPANEDHFNILMANSQKLDWEYPDKRLAGRTIIRSSAFPHTFKGENEKKFKALLLKINKIHKFF